MAATPDPVRARRARVGRLAAACQRAGWGLYAMATAGFLAAVALQFPGPLVAVVVACLAAGSLLLAPAIVIGFGVRAAERADRQAGAGPGP